MSATAARETIFALSSGAPPAAIAIVRVSGPAASSAVQDLCGSVPEARRATLRSIRDTDGRLLDRALILWFPGPATATGEDLAELHLHGGRAVVAAVLARLGTIAGCRAALPGEFTRRAFENGRVDLLQAEGLADLLSAETEGARLRAVRLVEGGLSRLIAGWRDRLVMFGARVEAILEFGGDDPDIAPDPTIRSDIAVLAEELRQALAMPPAERLRDGVRVVIAGPPNAGKSTLINALAGRDVAIATPVPGTTRDLIEAPVTIGGVAMVLTDTAGLRETEDQVERLGIASTHRALERADIILWLGDPDERPSGSAVSVRCICAKADLKHGIADDRLDAAVSALRGEGIGALQQKLRVWAEKLLPTDTLSLTSMQRSRIEPCLNELRSALAAEDETIVAEHLREASAMLDELTGRYAVEPMLDALFGRFCIGK